MTKRFLIAVCLALLAASRAEGQKPPATPPKATPPKATPPKATPAPPVPAASAAAANELFAAMDLQSSIRETAAAMVDMEINRSMGLVPYRSVMLQWLQKYMTWDAMRPRLTRMYVDAFTDAELKELAAFYRTPVGKKALKKMPELFQKSAEVGAEIGSEHREELMKAMDARRVELEKQRTPAAGAKPPASGAKPTPAAKKP